MVPGREACPSLYCVALRHWCLPGFRLHKSVAVLTGLPRAQIRLTNEKIAAVLVAVEGAKAAMLEMGWVEDGEFLVLPAGVQLSMREVRDIEDAKAKLKKEEEQAMMRAALPKKKEDPEMKRLREQLEADKKERAARGPITQVNSCGVNAPWGLQ